VKLKEVKVRIVNSTIVSRMITGLATQLSYEKVERSVL
jgi:hypothetical protein